MSKKLFQLYYLGINYYNYTQVFSEIGEIKEVER